MSHNNSPWIKELNRTRPIMALNQDHAADVVVVGGGIAGVVTAYYLLRDTDQSVLLLEADKIAHGATGHNAGQIASYFERPLPDIVKEFGVELATDGQRSVESAWELLEQLIKDTDLQINYHVFTGHAGLSSMEQLIPHLQSSKYRVEHDLLHEKIIVADNWSDVHNIPAEFSDLYTVVPQPNILALLETNNTDYIAALSYKKGCMNSALFTEKLVTYLTKTYPDRFTWHEGSFVDTITLYEDYGELRIALNTVTAKKIILCTNGFENFTIKNESGPAINTLFHHSVTGLVGYMSAYVQEPQHPPIAISYFPKQEYVEGDDLLGESYYYVTRRPYEHEKDRVHDLICVGGPDKELAEGEKFAYDHNEQDKAKTHINQFLRSSYNKYLTEDVSFSYAWQGLMGYTPNGIRRIGVEPCNPILLYNLGCNGIGILPSIYGGKRIAQCINNENLAPSIFDPLDPHK